MKKNEKQQLKTFNSIYKEYDELYRDLAKKAGLSLAAFTLLYTIRNSGQSWTQKDFCEQWSMSKQTINSALKPLLDSEVISFEFIEGNRKIKRIILTSKGESFLQQKIDPIIQAEEKSFTHLTSAEQSIFFSLLRKYLDGLEEEMNPLLQEQKG